MYTEQQAHSLRSVLARVTEAEAAVAAAETARVRALAEAGQIAREVATAQRASVKLHDMALRGIAAEIATATRSSDRSVQRQIGDAITLVEDYPATLRAWQAGALSRQHVRIILEAGSVLPPSQRAEFDDLAASEAQSDTPSRVRSRLAVIAESLHPRTLTERHDAARETRSVRVVPVGEGMSDLIATLPTPLADAVYDRLTQMSRTVIDARTHASSANQGVDATPLPLPDTSGAAFGLSPAAATAGARADTAAGSAPSTPVDAAAAAAAADTRSADQIRADVLADLLLTAAPMADPTRTDDGPGTLGAIRAKIQVVVPALTMLQPENENLDPAQLVGRGPVDADLARQIAEASTVPWDRVITHPVTGAVLRTDTYQRTTAIDRFVRARDRHCRFPGCTLPAVRCEVDHNHDYALGGATDVCNLSCLCQRHHSMKQFAGWLVEQLPGGRLAWTSPLGRVYIDDPPAYPPAVRFIPDDDPPTTDAPF